jgi:Fic family protein
VRVAIDEREASANSRLTAIHLSLLTLRWMEYWKRNVADYDCAMIALAVVAITAERWTRAELEPELRDLTRPLPGEHLTVCNVSSIAAATGLNRETARRKVNALVAQGILAKDENGVVGSRRDTFRRRRRWSSSASSSNPSPGRSTSSPGPEF